MNPNTISPNYETQARPAAARPVAARPPDDYETLLRDELERILSSHITIHTGEDLTIEEEELVNTLLENAMIWVHNDRLLNPKDYLGDEMYDDFFREILAEALGPYFGLPVQYFS